MMLFLAKEFLMSFLQNKYKCFLSLDAQLAENRSSLPFPSGA